MVHGIMMAQELHEAVVGPITAKDIFKRQAINHTSTVRSLIYKRVCAAPAVLQHDHAFVVPLYAPQTLDCIACAHRGDILKVQVILTKEPRGTEEPGPE